MDLSVIIPTHRRPDKIAACLRKLAKQTLAPDRYEVLVGLDGPDPATAAACESAWREAGGRAPLRVLACQRAGLAATRNRLLELATGALLLSLNDDVLPDADLCKTHAVEGARLAADRKAGPSSARGATIVGDAPWVTPHDDSLFDRLVRETSMVFFYDQMVGPRRDDPAHDWGFRHAFGLNVSYPTGLVREVGGYAVFPEKYGYEDVEIAWRLRQRFGLPVLFRPGARALHDHRYTPDAYLERELRLGHAAVGFARAAPACALELFGRDILADAELAYSDEFLVRERAQAERLYATVARLSLAPADAIAGVGAGNGEARGHAGLLLRAVYEQHLPLKRYAFRRGLVAAARGEASDALTLFGPPVASSPRRATAPTGAAPPDAPGLENGAGPGARDRGTPRPNVDEPALLAPGALSPPDRAPAAPDRATDPSLGAILDRIERLAEASRRGELFTLDSLPALARLHAEVDRTKVELDRAKTAAAALRASLVDRVAAHCAQAGHTRIALYGAGWHTTPLVRQPWQWRGVRVVAILDDHPKRTSLCGVPVLRPADLRDPIDAVVVSSDAHEAKIEAAALAHFRPLGVPVLRIYGDEPREADARTALHRLTSEFGVSAADADWLIENRGERHDATLPMLLPERTELHLRRYDHAAALATGKRVLDAASGTGYGAALLHRAGAASVDGVELDPRGVDYATRRHATPGRVRFHRGDVTAIDLPDRAFDLITSFETVEHLPDPDAMLTEFCRLLAPGGVLLISTPNDIGPTPHHHHSFTRDSFQRLLMRRFMRLEWFGQVGGDAVRCADLPPGIFPLGDGWPRPDFFIVAASAPQAAPTTPTRAPARTVGAA